MAGLSCAPRCPRNWNRWASLDKLTDFGRSTFEQVTLAHRALQIGRATLKGNALPDRAVAAAKAVYERARSCGEHVVSMQIAGVMASFGHMADTDIAHDAESVASGEFAPGYAMAVQGVWDFAAQAYRAAKDVDAERRCRLRSVEMTLERARSAPSALSVDRNVLELVRELDGDSSAVRLVQTS